MCLNCHKNSINILVHRICLISMIFMKLSAVSSVYLHSNKCLLRLLFQLLQRLRICFVHIHLNNNLLALHILCSVSYNSCFDIYHSCNTSNSILLYSLPYKPFRDQCKYLRLPDTFCSRNYQNNIRVS